MRVRTRHKPGVMNKNEARFDAWVRKSGEYLVFFEPFRMTLAPKLTYCPDFMLIDSEGYITLVEVKPRAGNGYWAMEDSKIKMKMCADKYPFPLVVMYPPKKGDEQWGLSVVSVGVDVSIRGTVSSSKGR